MSSHVRFLLCAGLLSISSILFVSNASAQAADEPLTLDAAFARALTSNPSIAAARLRRAIDLAGIDVAGERPNPEAHAELTNELPKQAFGLAVPLELGGKRSRRIDLAQATLQTGEAELTATILDIRTQVRRAYSHG